MEDKDDINQIISSQIQFDERRRDILSALQRTNMIMAKMYEGAIVVLQYSDIPNRIHLSAHSIRELIEKMPQYSNLPKISKPRTANDLLKSLKVEWDSFYNNNTNWDSGIEWFDGIKNQAIKLLRKFSDTFNSNEDALLTKKDRIRIQLRVLNEHNSLDPIPKKMEDEWIDVIKECDDYFTNVCHHKPTSADRFIVNLTNLELVLHAVLVSDRTHENRLKMLDIIRSVDNEAN